MIPWKSVAAVFLAYGLAFALTFSFVIIDLWAKAYDGPSAIRMVAVWTMAFLTGGFCYVLFLISRLVLSQASVWWRWGLTLFLLVLELAFFVRGLDLVDWLPVYLSAFILPACLWLKNMNAARNTGRVFASIIACVLLAVTIGSRIPSHRLARYTSMLKDGDWDCDYKTRAIYELCDLGSDGQDAIIAYAKTVNGEERRLLLAHLPASNPVGNKVRTYLEAQN